MSVSQDPSTSDRTELIVQCGPSLCPHEGLRCHFPSGATEPCTFEAEGQYFVCRPSKGLLDESQVKVCDADGKVLCAAEPEGCTIRRRPGRAPVEDIPAALEVEQVQPTKSALATAVDVFQQLSWPDRMLPFLIIGAMILGVVLGYYTDIGTRLDTVKVTTVSLPIAVGLWLMMWPVLCKVRYELLFELFRSRHLWRQVALSLVLNWLVGPLLMTGLAWATLPDLPHYRNGVILVGLARCIAMVLIWNELARGHAEYCAVLVAVNSVMQIVLYAPLALFYLKVVSRQAIPGIDFWDVARSVLIFLGCPLVAGIITRYGIIWTLGQRRFQRFMDFFGPVALLALVYTVVVLFGLQGRQVIENIGSVCRVAVPMCLYFSIMFVGTLIAARRLGATYEQTVTQAFTSSSNNFELAIAIAAGTFGALSPEALAATIGPLVEVPVLLALVYVALFLQARLKWVPKAVDD